MTHTCRYTWVRTWYRHPDAIALTMGPPKPPRIKRPVLSDRDLTILKWRDEEGASYEEVGRRSGLELGHVYRIVSRARSLLGAKVPNDQASHDPVKP